MSGTVEETGTESVPETVEKAVEAVEDTVTETAETAADIFIPAADAVEEAAVSAETAIDETADDTEAAIQTAEASAESAAEAVIAEDPAITRLKSHLSVGIKSDEEIARERSLKKVTYKDILQEEDFEEIDLKNAQQEKE